MSIAASKASNKQGRYIAGKEEYAKLQKLWSLWGSQFYFYVNHMGKNDKSARPFSIVRFLPFLYGVLFSSIGSGANPCWVICVTLCFLKHPNVYFEINDTWIIKAQLLWRDNFIWTKIIITYVKTDKASHGVGNRNGAKLHLQAVIKVQIYPTKLCFSAKML